MLVVVEEFTLRVYVSPETNPLTLFSLQLDFIENENAAGVKKTHVQYTSSATVIHEISRLFLSKRRKFVTSKFALSKFHKIEHSFEISIEFANFHHHICEISRCAIRKFRSKCRRKFARTINVFSRNSLSFLLHSTVVQMESLKNPSTKSILK